MKLFGNDAVYRDGCFYRFDFGYRNVPGAQLHAEAHSMILRGVQRCMMPINAPYSDANMWEVWRYDPRPVRHEDGSVKVGTILSIEHQRRLRVTNDTPAAATTLAVIRFPRQQQLHGAVMCGLPSPMWLVEVDRQYEAGWVLSRRVADVDKEAATYRDEWKAQESAKKERRVHTPKPTSAMLNRSGENEVIEGLAVVLGGKVVEQYLNPLHVRAKLRMVNFFEGWPHIAEVSRWVGAEHSDDKHREEGERSYRQMQAFHGASRADAKKAAAGS
ncbi:hypothetical protein D3230_10115 [Leucobacter chromiireducens subsp. solipictus]|uniref:Uncharacterized protein n=2 Tax=Leucobacter TaxID=55968 RepID=A0ABS1SGG6_9MICO|nr:hypothetical protein [Leucobacter chromiireducens subsp. solipictus]